MVEAGIVAVSRNWSDGLIMRRVIVIAVAGASLAGCSSFSMDAFKPTPPTAAGPARTRCRQAPTPAPRSDRAARHPARSRVPAPDSRFLGHLHAEQVPAGDDPGAGDPQSRRFIHPRHDDVRSQSGGGGTAAGRPAAQGRPESRCRSRKSRSRPQAPRAAPAGSPFPNPTPHRRRPTACRRPLIAALQGRLRDCRRIASCIDCDYGDLRHAPWRLPR